MPDSEDLTKGKYRRHPWRKQRLPRNSWKIQRHYSVRTHAQTPVFGRNGSPNWHICSSTTGLVQEPQQSSKNKNSNIFGKSNKKLNNNNYLREKSREIWVLLTRSTDGAGPNSPISIAHLAPSVQVSMSLLKVPADSSFGRKIAYFQYRQHPDIYCLFPILDFQVLFPG